MSRICWHSPSDEVELWGGERAWMGHVCSSITIGMLDIQHNYQIWTKLINAAAGQSYLRYPSDPHDFLKWKSSLEATINIAWDDERLFQWHGHPISMFQLQLNTATRLGNDAVKLAARLHAQCEIHCWIDGPDRWWVADIIQLGLDSGVFRDLTTLGGGNDWQKVITFLRARDYEPVVLSYSVCDSFPNRDEAGWEPPASFSLRPSWIDVKEWGTMSQEEREEHHRDARDELWGELPTTKKWDIAMTALRARKGGLQISPEDWGTYTFGHGLSALDLVATDAEDRLDAAFDIQKDTATG